MEGLHPGLTPAFPRAFPSIAVHRGIRSKAAPDPSGFSCFHEPPAGAGLSAHCARMVPRPRPSFLVFTDEETEAGGHMHVWGHTLASGRAWAGAQVSMAPTSMGAASNRLLALVCPWPLLVQGRAHSLLATPLRRLCLQSVTKEMRRSQRSSQMPGHHFLSLLDPHRQPLQLPVLGPHASSHARVSLLEGPRVPGTRSWRSPPQAFPT